MNNLYDERSLLLHNDNKICQFPTSPVVLSIILLIVYGISIVVTDIAFQVQESYGPSNAVSIIIYLYLIYCLLNMVFNYAVRKLFRNLTKYGYFQIHSSLKYIRAKEYTEFIFLLIFIFYLNILQHISKGGKDGSKKLINLNIILIFLIIEMIITFTVKLKFCLIIIRLKNSNLQRFNRIDGENLSMFQNATLLDIIEAQSTAIELLSSSCEI